MNSKAFTIAVRLGFTAIGVWELTWFIQVMYKAVINLCRYV